MKQTVIAALATPSVKDVIETANATLAASNSEHEIIYIGLKAYHVEDVNIRDMRPGQTILETTRNRYGRDVHDLIRVKTITPDLQRGCRGIHVNTTKCYDAIATVRRATPLAHLDRS